MTSLNQSSAEFAPFPVLRFSLEQYRRLGETGVLSPADRVELLEGWIVPKMNHNPVHDGTIELVDNELRRWLPDGWRMRIQSAITTVDSEPEPDLAVVLGPAGRYLRAHPTGTEIAILVEVADTSLGKDRLKCRIYARERIPHYWIVNLGDQKIEVYTDPSGPAAVPAYNRSQDFGIGDKLPLTILGNQIAEIEVCKILVLLSRSIAQMQHPIVAIL